MSDRPDARAAGRARSRARVWGARQEEVRRAYPCDGLLAEPREEWFRAVTVDADRSTVFRWLCQLKVAPYSYDLLDNAGRRSPRHLTPGAGDLEAGQRVATIFRLVSFAEGRHMTLLMDDPKALRLFGPFALTYAVAEERPGTTRLLVGTGRGRRRGRARAAAPSPPGPGRPVHDAPAAAHPEEAGRGALTDGPRGRMEPCGPVRFRTDRTVRTVRAAERPLTG